LISSVQDRFEQLRPRERLLVTAAGVAIVLAAILLLVVQPLYANSTHTAERVTDKQALLARLEQAAARLEPAAQRSGGQLQGLGQSMVVVVDRSTRSRGLGQYLKRNQPDGNTGIRLRFEDAPFDELIGWIAELQTSYGMTTLSANIDLSGASGRVNCSLVLNRPGV
jgi:general secretion pathway protein M